MFSITFLVNKLFYFSRFSHYTLFLSILVPSDREQFMRTSAYNYSQNADIYSIYSNKSIFNTIIPFLKSQFMIFYINKSCLLIFTLMKTIHIK